LSVAALPLLITPSVCQTWELTISRLNQNHIAAVSRHQVFRRSILKTVYSDGSEILTVDTHHSRTSW
jgi:hypothetical protein